MAPLQSLLYCLVVGISIASPIATSEIKRDDTNNPNLDGYLTYPQGYAYSCSAGQQLIINSAFKDAMYLAGQRGSGGNFVAPNWTGPDRLLVLDWFGTFSSGDKDDERRYVARNLQRVSNPRWKYKSKDLDSAYRFVDVFCPSKDTPTYDKNNNPSCQFNSNKASTVNVGFGLGAQNPRAFINLCPSWFNLADVTSVIQDMTTIPTHQQSVIWLYRTKGVGLLHELHHIAYKQDFDMRNTQGITYPQAIDMVVEGLQGKAYGPTNVKYLARNYGAKSSHTNVDSYVCFILATFIQKKFGVVPREDYVEWNPVLNAKRQDDDPNDLSPDPIDDDSLQPIDRIVAPTMSDLVYNTNSVLDEFGPPQPALPSCYGSTSTASASQPLLAKLIGEFCTSISALSVGCVDMPDPFAPTQTFNYTYNTGNENVAVGVSVSYDPDWQGGGSIPTDVDECNDVLGIALNGCDTNTVTAKNGGTVKNMGRIWDLSVHSLNKPGDFDWKPTNQYAVRGGCKPVS